MPFTFSDLADDHELNSFEANQTSNGETTSTANAGSVDLTTPGQVAVQTDIIAASIDIKDSGATNIDAFN